MIRGIKNGIQYRRNETIWLGTGIATFIRENTASIAMHKKCGFREIGIREKIAQMSNGVWHDVVLMELRSRIVGIN